MNEVDDAEPNGNEKAFLNLRDKIAEYDGVTPEEFSRRFQEMRNMSEDFFKKWSDELANRCSILKLTNMEFIEASNILAINFCVCATLCAEQTLVYRRNTDRYVSRQHFLEEFMKLLIFRLKMFEPPTGEKT